MEASARVEPLSDSLASCLILPNSFSGCRGPAAAAGSPLPLALTVREIGDAVAGSRISPLPKETSPPFSARLKQGSRPLKLKKTMKHVGKN
jgi:hypothetical protein